MEAEESEDVLRFWFPELAGADHARMVRQFEWWFRGGADSAIVERFAQLLERATRGELDHWSQWPRPRLALIIVLDQFSRSLYRDTARAFAQDPKALATLRLSKLLGRGLSSFSHWGIPRSSRTWIAQSHLPSSSRKMRRRNFVGF